MATRKELQQICKKRKVPGWYRMNKAELEKAVAKTKSKKTVRLSNKLLTDEENESYEELAKKIKVGRRIKFTHWDKRGMTAKFEGKIIETQPQKPGYLGDVGKILVKYKGGTLWATWAFYTKDNGKLTLLFTSQQVSSYTTSGVKMMKRSTGGRNPFSK